MANKTVHMITFIVLVVGGINWLLVGMFGFDLVMKIFTDTLQMPALTTGVYVLVGVSAIYELFIHKSTCTLCTAGGSHM